jgi:hypothetical protein
MTPKNSVQEERKPDLLDQIKLKPKFTVEFKDNEFIDVEESKEAKRVPTVIYSNKR